MTLHLRAAVAACLLLVAFASRGAIVNLHFGGAVDKVDAALAGTFQIGDAVSVDLSYDLAAPAFPGSNSKDAAYDLISLDLNFGAYSASYHTDPGHNTFVGVTNNDQTGLGVADAMGGSAFVTGGGAQVAGLPLQQGFVSLFDFTQTVFSDTSLPAALNLADFQTAVAGLQFCADPGCGLGSNPSQVEAMIDSLAVVVVSVPEPASAALALLGLGAALAATPRRATAAAALNV
jgi:hypothetical protein